MVQSEAQHCCSVSQPCCLSQDKDRKPDTIHRVTGNFALDETIFRLRACKILELRDLSIAQRLEVP